MIFMCHWYVLMITRDSNSMTCLIYKCHIWGCNGC